jgi:hypothetical protein
MISLNYMRQVTEQMYVPIAALVSGSPSERARLPLSRKIAVIAILQDVSYWENSHHTLLDMLGQIIHTSDILVQIIHTPALVPDPMSHSMHIMLARNKRDIAPPLAWHLIPKCRQNPSLWVDYAIESAEIEQQIKELIPEGMHPFDFAEIRRKQGRPLPVDWIASVTSRTARLADDTRFRKIPQEQKLAMNVLIHFDSLRATILRELVTLRLLTVSGGPRDTPAVEAARIVYRLWAQAHEPQSRDPIMMTPLSPAQVGLARSLMDIFELYPHPTLSEITSVIAGEQQYTQLRRILEAPECRAVPEEFKRWSLILAWSIPPGAPIAFESTTRVSQASFLGPQHSDEEVLAQVAAELGLISPLSLEQQQILRALAVYAPYLLIRFLANQQIFPPPVSIPQTAQARPEQSTMLPHPI